MKKSQTKTGIAKNEVPQVRKVAVIGAGVMGSGIAHHFVNKGIQTTLQDIKSEVIDKGMAMVRDELNNAVKKRKLTSQDMQNKLKLLSGSTSVQALQAADVVIEAAVEVMVVKKKIIASLETANVLTESNLFASNTSSLSVSQMQSSAKHPNNIVGMHFFNPVVKMPLVEVIKGKSTSALATAVIFNLALQTGKKPIIVNDGPGFLVNRILGVYMAEAGRLVTNEKCSPFVIDEAITRFGMPMGPFRLIDEVGIDVACHVAPVLENGLHSNRFVVDDKLRQMLQNGLLGKKTQKGFYLYDKKEVHQNTSAIDQLYGADLRATVP